MYHVYYLVFMVIPMSQRISDWVVDHKVGISLAGLSLAALVAAVGAIALTIILTNPSFLKTLQFLGGMNYYGVGSCFAVSVVFVVLSCVLLCKRKAEATQKTTGSEPTSDPNPPEPKPHSISTPETPNSAKTLAQENTTKKQGSDHSSIPDVSIQQAPGSDPEVSMLCIDFSQPIQRQLPKWIFSDKGLVGDAHFQFFLEYCFKKQKDEDLQQLLIWYFSQRKFSTKSNESIAISKTSISLPAASKGEIRENVDKKLMELTGYDWTHKDLQWIGPFIDRKGFAISPSAHNTNTSFVHETDIKEIAKCDQGEILDQTYVGKYSTNVPNQYHHIIQQPAARACVMTCAAMLLTDRGVEFDMRSLSHENLTTDEMLGFNLTKYGYKLIKLKPEHSSEALRSMLTKHGPCFMGVTGDIGGHKIILDEVKTVEKQTLATFRDPFHGWRVTMSFDRFIEIMGGWSRVDFQTLEKIV